MNSVRWPIFFLFLFFFPATLRAACHPSVNADLTQHVMAYGSLINEVSKQRTVPTAGESRPVMLKGFERLWGVHSNLPTFNMTFLTVVPSQPSSLNGAVFDLQYAEDIDRFDKREIPYCRVQILPSQLIFLDEMPAPRGQFWIYISAHKPQAPSNNHPLVQSYVDVFLSGCMTLEKKFNLKNFARGCVQTTHGWSEHWINDRAHPRRPWLDEPQAVPIDRLLQEQLPLYFSAIKLE